MRVTCSTQPPRNYWPADGAAILVVLAILIAVSVLAVAGL